MKNLLSLILCLSVLVGCGGGGGGGGTTGKVSITGIVRSITTGAPASPQATAQIGNTASKTDANDGSFALSVAPGATQLQVIPGTVNPVIFTFTFPAASSNFDVGDLYIGPESVSVTGRVFSAASGTFVPGATVKFAGKTGLTNASGVYTISGVAYDSTNTNLFLSLQGTVSASGFFPGSFTPTTGAIGGSVTIDDVFLSNDSGTDPPDNPFNISGSVLPANFAQGTVVQLFSGSTLVRQMTVGSANKYGFWVIPGTYIIKASNPNNGKSAADQSATLTSQTETVRKDVTLQ